MSWVMRVLLVALAALAAAAARADEAAIRRALAPRLVDAKIVSVQKLPQVQLFEVAIRGADGAYDVVYTDASGQFIFIGNLIEGATDRNLTAERLRKLSVVDWNALPLQWAITMKRGTGRRQIAILSDPNCPYCKRFEADLVTVDDITVHILPFAVIRPESVRQAKSVWCSKDRVKAWNDLMQKRIEPAAAPDCDNPIDALIHFGRGLGASATPTWFLPTGERYSGAMPMNQLVPLLDAAVRPK
ncbi:MAG TPA: DsbC family protein [Burkholderiaceae bacterium]|nr:DsbC family protein [Burkholderiaceae bacterium]